MKIAVATFAMGEQYQRAVNLGVQSKKAYCARHGYDFIFRTEPMTDRLWSWNKIPLLLQNIDRYDVIFWSDADVLITNPKRRLEDIIARYNLPSGKTVLITRDSAGNVNMGNFFLFNRPSAKELLQKIWAQRQFADHDWLENQAFIHLLGCDRAFAAAVHVEENQPNVFNAYAHVGDPAKNFRAGDLLLHFAGVKEPEDIERLMTYHYLHNRTELDFTRIRLAISASLQWAEPVRTALSCCRMFRIMPQR